MPNHRSRSNNRLLALEQELLAKRRLAQEGQNRQNPHQHNQEQTKTFSQDFSRSRQTNNRLLQLEQELLNRRQKAEGSSKELASAPGQKVNSSYGDFDNKSQAELSKAESKSSLFKSQVFDTGEPIILEYNSPDNSPDFSVITTSQALEDGELREIELSDKLTERLEPESPIVPEISESIEHPTEAEAEIETVLSQTAELEDGELPRIAVSDKLSERLESESPIVSELTENIERPTEAEIEIEIETETVLSQAAELEDVELPKIELSDKLSERLEPESPIVSELTENIERPTEAEIEIEIETETVLSQAAELEDVELPKIAVSDKLSDKLTELLEPESPIVPEIIENIERSTEPEAEIEIEIETVPSQGAELIAETEKQPNPIAADLPSVFAAIPTEPPEALTTPIATPAEPKSDRQPPRDSKPNPHSIFDRLGKNMAYATTFDVGTVELEQLFDEFDRTLEQAERKQTSDSVEQQRQNLELERRFDEFDRVLDRQEQAKTTKTPILKTQSPPEILADKKDPEEAAPELAILENQEIEKTPPLPEPNATPDQAIALEITPLESPQVAVVQPMNYEPKLDPNTTPQLNLKLEALLWQTGINFISLIIWLFNFICRQEVDSRSIIAALSDRREQKQSNDDS